MESEKKIAGKMAYDTYRIVLKNKSQSGEKFANFEDLPENLKKAWEVVEMIIIDNTKLELEIEKLSKMKKDMNSQINNSLTELQKE